MSDETLRAWALVSVSLFNTVLLLWLGLTLFLQADRRDPGVLLAGSGFLLGSLFFISHSALLLSTSWDVTRSNTLWLAVAMLPLLILPYVWYVVLLNNAGYWIPGPDNLRRRHRPWLVLLSMILVARLRLPGLARRPVHPRVERRDAVYLAPPPIDQGPGRGRPARRDRLSPVRHAVRRPVDRHPAEPA